MSTWNYRLCRVPAPGVDEIAIREVYYNAAGEPEGMSGEPPSLTAESAGELREELERMLRAFGRPVIDSSLPVLEWPR